MIWAMVLGSLSFQLCPLCFALCVLAAGVDDWRFWFCLGAMRVWLFLYCEIQVKINKFNYPQGSCVLIFIDYNRGLYPVQYHLYWVHLGHPVADQQNWSLLYTQSLEGCLICELSMTPCMCLLLDIITGWWIDPGWTPGAHQSRYITPSRLDRGEKI